MILGPSVPGRVRRVSTLDDRALQISWERNGRRRWSVSGSSSCSAPAITERRVGPLQRRRLLLNALNRFGDDAHAPIGILISQENGDFVEYDGFPDERVDGPSNYEPDVWCCSIKILVYATRPTDFARYGIIKIVPIIRETKGKLTKALVVETDYFVTGFL